MINLLHDLQRYLISGTLSHYFIQECNLLTTIGQEERQIALNAIKAVLSDPAKAIIKCPSEPDEIYGDICPDDLLSAFRRVSVDPSCEKSREDLVILLSQLDQWREQRYIKQLEADADEDADEDVSGRPDLRGLADVLKKIKHFKIFLSPTH